MNQSLIKQTIVDRLMAAKIQTFTGQPKDAQPPYVNVVASNVVAEGLNESGVITLTVKDAEKTTGLFGQALAVITPVDEHTALSIVSGAITHSVNIESDAATSTITLTYLLTLLS